MTDHPNSSTTPASAASANNSKAVAPKDRACPYCHVSFTSSSLGRHLDLYIKDKNPKPPDGIHNVDEIRKSRAGITRRQAKSSKRGTQSRSNNSEHNDTFAGSASPDNSQSDRRMGPYAFRNLFNTPHWTSTGVITDSDANQNLLNGDGLPVGTPNSGSGIGSGMDPQTRRRWIEDRDRGRAAELALLELVDSIKAASSQSMVPPPYDFDFLSCSFLDLVLRILSPPATLERVDFIPDGSSWPIDPPDESTYKVMQQKVRAHLLQWRETYHPPNAKKRRRSTSPDYSQGQLCGDQPEPIPLFIQHLAATWNAYSTQSMLKKGPDWHVATLRAFAREQHLHIETKKRLEYLETELSRARIDNARLTECQMPREWLHTPAAQLPMAKLAADKVERELRNGQLDAEKLIAKWRPRVQAAKAVGRQHEFDEPGSARLAMIGPAGVARSSSQRPSMNGISNSMAYDRRIPSEEDEEEDDYDEDEEDDEDEDGQYEEPDAMEPANGTISPSLRLQLADLASTRSGP